MWALDMSGSSNKASDSAVTWNDIQKPPFNVDNPVMALAQNHIHFLDVPDTPAGEADIFVIHCTHQKPKTPRL